MEFGIKQVDKVFHFPIGAATEFLSKLTFHAFDIKVWLCKYSSLPTKWNFHFETITC